MAKPVPKWKDPGTGDRPLSGPALLVDRALVLLVALGMLALATTPFLRRAPAPAGIRFLCLAGTNDQAPIPLLPYRDALTGELEALFPGDLPPTTEPTTEPSPDGETGAESKRVERVAGTTREELVANLRRRLAAGSPQDALVVYCQMHLVQARGEAGLVCGDFRYVEAGTQTAVPGLLPVAEIVRAMDEVDAPCRLLLLDAGNLTLEPQLGLFLNDFSTGLGASGEPGFRLAGTASEDGDEASTEEPLPESADEVVGSPTFILVSRTPHESESLNATRRMTRFASAIAASLRSPDQADRDADGSLSVAEFLAAIRTRARSDDRETSGPAGDGALLFRDRRWLAEDDESASQTVLLESAAWPSLAGDEPTGDPDESLLTSELFSTSVIPPLPASSFDPLLQTLEAVRKRSDALLVAPVTPATWRLFTAPRELLEIERDLARVEFQMLFQRNTDDDLLDLEIALRRVVREIEGLERTGDADASAVQSWKERFGPEASPDAWKNWCALQHARFRLVDVVRLHDRIGHHPEADWLLPAAKKLFAAITADAGEPLKIGSSAATILTEEIEREVAGLVGGLLKRLGSDAPPAPHDVRLARELLPGGLVSAADRARLLRAIIERVSRDELSQPASGHLSESTEAPVDERGRVGIPDETLSTIAGRRFELHALLIRELLDPQARVSQDPLTEEWAARLARANQARDGAGTPDDADDAAFRTAIYRVLQP